MPQARSQAVRRAQQRLPDPWLLLKETMELGTLNPGSCWDTSMLKTCRHQSQEQPECPGGAEPADPRNPNSLRACHAAWQQPGRGPVLQCESAVTSSLLQYQLVSLLPVIILTIPTMKLHMRPLRWSHTPLSTSSRRWVQQAVVWM